MLQHIHFGVDNQKDLLKVLETRSHRFLVCFEKEATFVRMASTGTTFAPDPPARMSFSHLLLSDSRNIFQDEEKKTPGGEGGSSRRKYPREVSRL